MGSGMMNWGYGTSWFGHFVMMLFGIAVIVGNGWTLRL
jgi:hypothetical protein